MKCDASLKNRFMFKTLYYFHNNPNRLYNHSF
jgi:hypothetical protein